MVAIFVLTLFLFFISVDLIVLKIQGKSHPAFEPEIPQFDSTIFENMSFAIPSNTFFSKGHTWLRKNSDGLISIGIDELGSMALGTLSILNCVPVGQDLKRGEMIFEGAYGNKIVKFLSPINGIVKSVNENILGKKISNPYETWGVQLISNEFSESMKLFLSGSEALNWMKKEFIKLKNFIDSHSLNVELAGVTMYDGGSLYNGTSSLLVDKTANDFEKEFLLL
jgi:glycine cleavage system H protein